MPVARAHPWRFRLRSILLWVHMLVLIVPLGSIYVFRLYENELVRETESELIAQGAYITAMYKQAIHPLINHLPAYGVPIAAKRKQKDDKYNIIAPTVDVASAPVYPPRPDALNDSLPPDPLAARTGKTIFPILDEATLTTLAGVRITDSHGIVVAGREETGMSLAHVEEVSEALQGQYSARLRQRISKHEDPALTSVSRGTGMRLFVALPIIDNDRVIGAVLLSRSPRSILKGLQDEQERMLFAAGIIIAITVLLALVTSYAISRPIHALIRQTQRIARGEKDVPPIAEPITQELALLSQNVARMADTIAERSDYIRNFAMHVSHEFKTPLTAIQGAIELIHEHGDSMKPEQLQKFLANITHDTDRLKILVSRLLELARADVMQANAEATDVGALLRHLQARYAERLSIGELREPLHAHVAQDVLETVCINLLENSLQHGATHIRMSAYALDGSITIDVIDNGAGISAGNSAKLFTPFFTTKREHGGTGLGLVISQALLRAFYSDLQCIHAPSGAHFRILLRMA
ncbi:MAG: ATP-binding protein [Pseudomonadota bacterium]